MGNGEEKSSSEPIEGDAELREDDVFLDDGSEEVSSSLSVPPREKLLLELGDLVLGGMLTAGVVTVSCNLNEERD